MQVRSSVPREDEYTNGLVGTSLGDDRLGGCGRIVSAHVQGFFQYLAVTHTASIVCVLLLCACVLTTSVDGPGSVRKECSCGQIRTYHALVKVIYASRTL